MKITYGFKHIISLLDNESIETSFNKAILNRNQHETDCN